MTNRPPWIKTKASCNAGYEETLATVRAHSIHTVCEEALCPNIGECWKNGTATFLIMGDVCTRNCGFCSVKTGSPRALREEEPKEVAEAVKRLKLSYAVITSVTRDDLNDGGSAHFAKVVEEIKTNGDDTLVEVLAPDFFGDEASIAILVDARPDVYGHNIEVTENLHSAIKKPPSTYRRSLEVLRIVKELDPKTFTKSGLIVGLGETLDDILKTIDDLASVGVDLVTIGQYLAPTTRHTNVAHYWSPDEFEHLKKECIARGIKHAEAGPMVRSSYNAKQSFEALIGLR